MKTFKMAGMAFFTCSLFVLFPLLVEAHDYGRGRGYRHHGYNGGVRAFIGVAGPMLYYSPYTYSYNPYPRTVVIQQVVPPVQAPAPVVQPSQQPQYWYFCESANGYYPYVENCQEGWQMVPATPPGR